jgi:hypothetical protein
VVSCAVIGLVVSVFMEFGWEMAAFRAELVRRIMSLQGTSYNFLIQCYWPFVVLAEFFVHNQNHRPPWKASGVS